MDEDKESAAAEVCRLLAEANRLDAAGNARAGQKTRDEAGARLVSAFGRFLSNYFRRRRVADDELGDYIQDVYLKLIKLDQPVHTNAFAFICRIAHSTLVDRIRYRTAGMRANEEGESVEVGVDDEAWQRLADTAPTDDVSADMDTADCVQAKLKQLSQTDPLNAQVLDLWSRGDSYRTIATIVYNKAEADVTPREEGNVRQRVNAMLKKVRALFQECKD